MNTQLKHLDMDYSKIKSYQDYVRYDEFDENTEVSRIKKRFLLYSLLEEYRDKIQENLDNCKNPAGCECADKGLPEGRDEADFLMSFIANGIYWDYQDIKNFKPELLDEDLYDIYDGVWTDKQKFGKFITDRLNERTKTE